jgi:hypothetical protein
MKTENRWLANVSRCVAWNVLHPRIAGHILMSAVSVCDAFNHNGFHKGLADLPFDRCPLQSMDSDNSDKDEQEAYVLQT